MNMDPQNFKSHQIFSHKGLVWRLQNDLGQLTRKK